MRKITLITLLLASAAASLPLYAYPPDNAAVLYYKHMEYFSKPEAAVWDEICELPTSGKTASAEARAFIEKQHKTYLIPELELASELKHCDWGLDLSQGFSLQMPGLSKMKVFGYLILADGAMAAERGEIGTALDSNLVVRRMAHHRSNDTLISVLVAYSMVKRSDEALAHLLATHPLSETVLVELKRELLLAPYQPLSFREPLLGERQVAVMEISRMTRENFQHHEIEFSEKDMKRAEEIFRKNNPGQTQRSVAYVEQYYDRVFALLEGPYAETFAGFKRESQKVVDDFEAGNDDAFWAGLFVPALAKCYNYTTRWQTEYHALLTALDVYIVTRQTGKLPDKLPENTYTDAYSGKPFMYEITEDGFTLRCRQKDLVDKTIHEYTYKLPRQ